MILGAVWKIFPLSLLKYVKIRWTLVQLKQFKKIKPLSECNFPHFTLESKYQTLLYNTTSI